MDRCTVDLHSECLIDSRCTLVSSGVVGSWSLKRPPFPPIVHDTKLDKSKVGPVPAYGKIPEANRDKA